MLAIPLLFLIVSSSSYANTRLTVCLVMGLYIKGIEAGILLLLYSTLKNLSLVLLVSLLVSSQL